MQTMRIIGLANPFRKRPRSVIYTHKALHGNYMIQKRGRITQQDMLNHATDMLGGGLVRKLGLDVSGFQIIEVY